MRFRHTRVLFDTIRLLRSQWWGNDRIDDYRAQRLVSLLKYAVEHVPFYAELGLSPHDIRSPGDLKRFPVVTKLALQSRPDDFLSREFGEDDLHESFSSGTTGQPTVTYFDPASWYLCKYALKARRVLSAARWGRHRVLLVSDEDVPDEPRAAVPWLGTGFLKIRGLRMGTDLAGGAREIATFRPTILYGFPSYLLALAEAAAENGIEVPTVEVIYTSSEMLSQGMRSALERAYGGRVIDIYGSTEFKEIAVQCESGRYHVNFESVHLESQNEAEGSPRLLVTTLVNKGMPLIRYEIGDSGRVERGTCACGRHSEHVVGLLGRLSEMLVFPDNTRLSPYLVQGVVERSPSVKRFRIAHERPWLLRIEVLARPRLTEADQEELVRKLRSVVPAGCAVQLAELDDARASSSRFVITREF